MLGFKIYKKEPFEGLFFAATSAIADLATDSPHDELPPVYY